MAVFDGDRLAAFRCPAEQLFELEALPGRLILQAFDQALAPRGPLVGDQSVDMGAQLDELIYIQFGRQGEGGGTARHEVFSQSNVDTRGLCRFGNGIYNFLQCPDRQRSSGLIINVAANACSLASSALPFPVATLHLMTTAHEVQAVCRDFGFDFISACLTGSFFL